MNEKPPPPSDDELDLLDEFPSDDDGDDLEVDGELAADAALEAGAAAHLPAPAPPAAPRVPLARIAIVGRPNVGKSTLANRMARRRVSIVDPHEGVTRDRVAQIAQFDLSTGKRIVEVIDT